MFEHVVNEDAIDKLSYNQLIALHEMLREKTEEYPDWYGIEGIKYHFINSWADPEIIWKGRRCSCYEVEDTMWAEYLADGGDENDDKAFDKYMLDNADWVRELTDQILFPEYYKMGG